MAAQCLLSSISRPLLSPPSDAEQLQSNALNLTFRSLTLPTRLFILTYSEGSLKHDGKKAENVTFKIHEAVGFTKWWYYIFHDFQNRLSTGNGVSDKYSYILIGKMLFFKPIHLERNWFIIANSSWQRPILQPSHHYWSFVKLTFF